MNESELRHLLPDERPLPTGRRRDMEERLMEQIEAGEKTSRQNFRLLVGAAAAVAIAGALVGVVVAGGGDGDGDRSDQLGSAAECTGGHCPPDTDSGENGSGSEAAVVDLVTAPRALVTALQDERNLASIELTGLADAVELPVASAEEARSRTDAAVSGLAALVDAGPVGAEYQPALDELAGLATLRDDVDTDAGPRTLANVESADAVFDRYAQLLTALLEAQGAFVATIDDPELAAGAAVYHLGLLQQERTAAIGRTAMFTAVQPDEAAVTDLSRLREQLQEGNDALLQQATGTPYEDAAAAGVDELEATGFLASVTAVIEGDVDIADLLAALDAVGAEGWPVLLDSVEQRLTAPG